GRSLTDPFFASLFSLPDGLYSTFWGDGLCGGVATWASRPPWNYDLMAAGYVLALLPTLLIGLGLVVAVVQLVRRPQAEWFLILGTLAGLAVALLYLVIGHPYYGHAKAIYELTGLLSACALAGLGFDLLARLGKVPMVLVTIVLGTWALTAYASLWIQPDGAVTQNWVGLQAMSAGPSQFQVAENHFRKALAADPHSVAARLNWASLLQETVGLARGAGDARAVHRLDRSARELINDVLRDDPTNADALTRRAMFARADGNADQAIADLRQASRSAPDNVDIYFILGNFLMEQHRLPEAEAAYRETLRVVSGHPSAHANLALILALQGHAQEAVANYLHALALRPDQSTWLADLSWLLATGQPPLRHQPYQAVQARQVDD
ncbi:MAG TPA: tetratricopeptide repeat protein, partial [Gemmataceae bacterium]|nr:tetratricopeptide repeat protein [Gemmataceae bacterium]